MPKARSIFKKISPAKINRQWQARKKINNITNKFSQKQNWRNLPLKEQLKLVQKAIKDASLEREAAKNISKISFRPGKKNWEKKSQQLKEYEESLRMFATDLHKKIRKGK